MRSYAVSFAVFMAANSSLLASQVLYVCVNKGCDLITFADSGPIPKAVLTYENSKGDGFYVTDEQFMVNRHEKNLRITGSFANDLRFFGLNIAFAESENSVTARVKFTDPAGLPLVNDIFECEIANSEMKK